MPSFSSCAWVNRYGPCTTGFAGFFSFPPTVTTPTPVVWMPRDPVKASENEVRETRECGLRATDEGAWLDDRRVVQWDALDFEKVPIWKEGTKY